ncbi:phosphate ABC transporter substrate-binding protein, PhoT family [bacterium A37T11]|nr:phosphate ABC transporter substrate-binding protein, PhoT family [bacterium A37T11]
MVFLLPLCIAGCSNPPSKDKQTVITGRITVLVDQTILPIVEDVKDVFESTYTSSEITLRSGPENNLVNALLKDSAKFAILSRTLTNDEIKQIESRKFYPRARRFATDGIALITNKSNPDSLINADEVIKLMQGKASVVKQLVFDNQNSSTVRQFKTFANVEKLPENGVYALRSNADVVKYVYEYPGSIGVIGVNWIVQPDTLMESYLKNIKVLSVKNVSGKPGSDGYYKPSQTNLALGLYAFSRHLYFIDCGYKTGLGMGFASFMSGERGQKIILKSGLLPDSIPPREINIKN